MAPSRRWISAVAALALTAAAAAGWRWASADAALRYEAAIPAPTWASEGPAVLIDNAHWNGGTGDGRLTAFAGLLAADGYRVLPGGNATRAETLADARVGVVVNPLGVVGTVRRWGAAVGAGDWPSFDDDGLLSQEIETTAQWVENGGSLLLAVDPAPYARGARGLAERLGVRLHDRLVVDVGHSDGPEPSRLLFSRENGLIGAHRILDGWPGAPPVNRVVVFGGLAMEPPADGTILLRLSPSAAEVAHAGAPPTAGRRVAGLALAVALERGRGRVVVLGDTELLTIERQSGVRPTGLSWPDTNNERFVRYVMRWLSRRDAR
ncbi:MAG: hypothetical protein AB7O28_13275 [Vicinamibacterales bacterium]